MSKFSFGTPATTAGSTSFAFGTPKPATSSSLGGTSFGAQTVTTVGGSLTFGTPAPAAATTATSGLNLRFTGPAGATPTLGQPSNLQLGSATSTATRSLFATLTTAVPSAPSATALTFGTPSTTGGNSFGPTTGAPVTGALSFGAPTTSAQSAFGTGTGGLFGTKAATSAAPVNTVGANKGLGGLDVSVSSKGLSHGSTSPTVAKENLIPNELTQTIDSFKEFVKTQKSFSSDIARGSSRPLNRCAEDTASLMEMLTTLAGSVQRDRSLADKLKQDTAKALQNAEIAQRTHDTPPGLQYENVAPLHFFMELAESFEHEIMVFRSQIEATEKHIQTMMAPRALTPQELTAAMSKIHESLIAVAGRLQSVHAKVQQQKEQYLNFRKYVLKDSSNVFEDVSKFNGKTSRTSIGRITSGPTPFGPGNKSFLSSTAISTGRPPSYGTPNPLAWGNSTAIPSTTNLTLGSTMKPPTASLNFNPPINLTAPLSSTDSNSSFQLQKPPIGNKRGKY